MDDNTTKPKRNGIHKYLHVSKLDVYVSAVVSVAFFTLLFLKLLNRILDWGLHLSYITWVDTMILAVTWAILGFAFHGFYEKYERKYDT